MSVDQSPLVIKAPAKINLGLAILGKRPDGFHDLVSIFHAISLCDEVALTARDRGISMSCDVPGIPVGPENLVWQAADLVQSEFGISSGVHIDLRKRIAAGAGLGGGSSDAAAVVRGLCDMWNIDAPHAVVHELCARLGSDVPFFLTGGTALVEGRGERITPFDIDEELMLVVAMPSVHVPTGWAYSQLHRPFRHPQDYLEQIEHLRGGRIRLVDFCRTLRNDFQTPIERHHPEIARVRGLLESCGATAALMTGSGAAVFGAFESEDAAESAAHTISAEVPCVVAHSLKRNPPI